MTPAKKQMTEVVCLAFRHGVCGFCLLKREGKSHACDVNGWSFVKNSYKYMNVHGECTPTEMKSYTHKEKLQRWLTEEKTRGTHAGVCIAEFCNTPSQMMTGLVQWHQSIENSGRWSPQEPEIDGGLQLCNSVNWLLNVLALGEATASVSMHIPKISEEIAGAFGCEFLKNLILIGVCYKKKGKQRRPYDDVLENCNFSHQFLFRNLNIGQAKSNVHASVVRIKQAGDFVSKYKGYSSFSGGKAVGYRKLFVIPWTSFIAVYPDYHAVTGQGGSACYGF